MEVLRADRQFFETQRVAHRSNGPSTPVLGMALRRSPTWPFRWMSDFEDSGTVPRPHQPEPRR